MDNKVWIVSGISQGLGLKVTEKLLAQGYLVAGTTRDKSKIDAKLLKNKNLYVASVDITNVEQVNNFVKTTIKKFKKVDVLLNSAGYGKVGPFEEFLPESIHQNFNINLFGAMNLIRATLPYFRKQNFGHIINTSSILGFKGNLGSSLYSATKFALCGFGESLALEVAQFNINLTNVLPGAFRTNFRAPTSYQKTDFTISDYDQVRTEKYQFYQDHNQKQPGNPEKYAELLIKIAEAKNPPLTIFVGKDSFEMANKRIEQLQQDMKIWHSAAIDTWYNE